jgi:hypothetical protein
MDVKVTIEFVIKDICNEQDIDDDLELYDIARDAVEKEGLYSLCDYHGNFDITNVVRFTDSPPVIPLP